MVRPKHILVLNAGLRPVAESFISEAGSVKLSFMNITHLDDTLRLQGQVFDDVLWVRPLPWGHRHRDEIEFRIRSRIVRRQGEAES